MQTRNQSDIFQIVPVINVFQFFNFKHINFKKYPEKLNKFFNDNLDRIARVVKCLSPSLTDDDLSLLKVALRDFYIQRDQWSLNPMAHLDRIRITDLPNEQWPTFSEFNIYLQSLDHKITFNKHDSCCLKELVPAVHDIIKNYGLLLDRRTYPSIYKQKKQLRLLKALNIISPVR